MTIKIWLDIHWVIDELPDFFSFLSRAIVDAWWEVFILTWIHWSDKIEEDLKKKWIVWTDHFSISDYHRKIWTQMVYKSENHPFIEDKLWDSSKAEYCKQNGIDLCIDDSAKYNDYFETPYCQLFTNKQK